MGLGPDSTIHNPDGFGQVTTPLFPHRYRSVMGLTSMIPERLQGDDAEWVLAWGSHTVNTQYCELE